MSENVTVTMPQWVLGAAFTAALFGGIPLTSLVPPPLHGWAMFAAVTWFWWPLAWAAFKPGPWRSRADKARHAQLVIRGASAQAAWQAARAEEQLAEDNRAGAITIP